MVSISAWSSTGFRKKARAPHSLARSQFCASSKAETTITGTFIRVIFSPDPSSMVFNDGLVKKISFRKKINPKNKEG
jgi:hypothetical protein